MTRRPVLDLSNPPTSSVIRPPERPSAKGIRKPGTMNKTEEAWSRVLDSLKASGDILEWWFEAITLKLAADTRYTPDFVAMLADGEILFYEVKGFWRDDAKVKIKVASAKFPFRFKAVSKIKGGWQEREF